MQLRLDLSSDLDYIIYLNNPEMDENMDINQLRCFMAVAEELHFGQAAQKLEMMPASLSRNIRRLEDDLGVRLLNRSTRNVSLTEAGAEFFDEAGKVIAQFDALANQFKATKKSGRRTLRIGAIDSAARGLLPQLLNKFMQDHPNADIHLNEDKTASLIPKLKSGWLDMIFIRSPEKLDSSLSEQFITRETCVLAVPGGHPLASNVSVCVEDFKLEPMIVPERRSRPHSHDLTMNLFRTAGLTPHIAQFAEEKQTILSFVAARLGLAIVPVSFCNMNTEGVSYIKLTMPKDIKGLPLSMVWQKGTSDTNVMALLAIFSTHKTELIAGL